VPERIAKIVKAIQHLFEDMGIEVVDERMTQFIVQEIHSGKTLEEALKEPYVLNNSTPQWRREVLERPEVIKAVEEELEKAFGVSGGGEGK
jgi:predicted RNA binding protein with dsRBD fold (UPF0201 family)